MDALNQLEDGLQVHLKNLSSFDKYKQEVLLGHLDWYPAHKDPGFWKDNITNFEENDFQVFFCLCAFMKNLIQNRRFDYAPISYVIK